MKSLPYAPNFCSLQGSDSVGCKSKQQQVAVEFRSLLHSPSQDPFTLSVIFVNWK